MYISTPLRGCLELKVVFDSDERSDVGVRETFELMNILDVVSDQLVEGAHVDLLTERCDG